MCTGWRILGTPPGGALSEGASRRPLGWWGVRGLLAVLALLAVAGSAPAWDFTMDLPPGWTMESPDEGDMVRCDLALEPGKTSAVLQVKRYDFDTVEEAGAFGTYLRERMRYDDKTTLLKNTEGLVSGIASVVHLVVERRQSGTYQREIFYVPVEKAWFEFNVLTTPELFAQVKLRSDELLSRVRLVAGAAGSGGASSASGPVRPKASAGGAGMAYCALACAPRRRCARVASLWALLQLSPGLGSTAST